MAYCSVCLVTDYDCWMDDSRQHVSMDQFFATYGGALTKAQALFATLLRSPLRDTPKDIRQSLENAMLTPPQNMNTEQQQWFNVLCQ